MIFRFGGLNAAGIRLLYYLQIIGFTLILIFVLREFTEPGKRQVLKIGSGFGESIGELFARGTRLKTLILFASLDTIPL